MAYLKKVALLGTLLFLFAVGSAPAQVSVGVEVGSDNDYSDGYSDDYSGGYSDVGAEPVCPYGYYDYYPYDCVPYGYYGPSFFINGVFIGVGPWYHSYYGGGTYGGGGYSGGYGGNDYRYEGRGYRSSYGGGYQGGYGG